MNRTIIKREISNAVKEIALKHGVEIKVAPITKVADHMEGVLVINNSNVSRFDQVKALYNKGLKTAKEIADRIGSHPSYVGTLLHKVKAAA